MVGLSSIPASQENFLKEKTSHAGPASLEVSTRRFPTLLESTLITTK